MNKTKSVWLKWAKFLAALIVKMFITVVIKAWTEKTTDARCWIK